jgi:uncharacterized protein (TIGR02594 family)
MPAKKTAKKAAATPKRLIVTAEGLNVREAPTLQAKVVDILSRGDIVQWISTSGDGYFHKITHNGTEGWASHKYLQFITTPAPASNFPWFEIAHAEFGTREVTGSGDNPRIVAYHRSTSLDAPSASNDETPWCSSFVNWCVERSGHAGTDSAWARSWLSWGRPTTSPAKGGIVVFTRGVSSGHVAFFVSKTATKIKVLGGNQSDEVNIS